MHLSLADQVKSGNFDDTNKTICRALAEAILSVNDIWGVFSKSRIALLPHQLRTEPKEPRSPWAGINHNQPIRYAHRQTAPVELYDHR